MKKKKVGLVILVLAVAATLTVLFAGEVFATDKIGKLDCTEEGQFAQIVGGEWECSDFDIADTLQSLAPSCLDGGVAKYDDSSSSWYCGEETLEQLTRLCTSGQVLQFNGTEWSCVSPPSISGYQIVQANWSNQTFSNSETKTYGILCPVSKKVLSAGYLLANNIRELKVIQSWPDSLNPNQWVFALHNTTPSAILADFSLYAICANAN